MDSLATTTATAASALKKEDVMEEKKEETTSDPTATAAPAQHDKASDAAPPVHESDLRFIPSQVMHGIQYEL